MSSSPLQGLTLLPVGNYEVGWDEPSERLVIIIGCSAGHRAGALPSQSGKTRLLATTHGFVPVDIPGGAGLQGLKLHLTVTLPNDAYFEGAARAANGFQPGERS